MNTKSLTAALILSLAALSSAHAADAPRADRIVDLPTVAVRPDAALRAELAANATQAPHIVDLPSVTVRPDRALRTELAARAQVMADTAAPAAEDARGLLPIGHNHGLHPQEFNE